MDQSSGEGGGDSKRMGLMTVNDLNYVLEPDLSVAVNKSAKKHFFQSAEYASNQTGICIINSGADYVDTRRSYLSFEATCTAPTDAFGYFGLHGSACNLINTLTVSTRSGDELCRIQDFGLLKNMMIPLEHDDDWMKTVGAAMGVGACVPDSTSRRRFVIPMYELAPLFGYGRLMPAMLMSGMRFQFTWEKPTTALFGGLNKLQSGAGDDTTHGFPERREITDFKITNAYFTLQSVQLSDSIQRGLNELSATNGLEIVYTDWEKTEAFYGSTNTAVNIEIRKSCSRALKAFARVRAINDGNTPGFNDSFAAEPGFPWKEYQWQLGSLYFPQQPVRSQSDDPWDIAPEAYANLLESVDKYHGEARQPALSFDGKTAAENGDWFYEGISKYPKGEFLGTLDQQSVLGVCGLAMNTGGQGYYPLRTNMVNRNQGYFRLGQYGSFLEDQHSIGVSLERSALFNLAGVPVNNSRVLAFKATVSPVTFQGANPTTKSDITKLDQTNGALSPAHFKGRNYSVFLNYVKLCRVFLNNVEVEQ
jgi:hypothetical protein